MCFTAHPYLHSGKCAATFQWQHKTLGFIAETQRSQPAASQRRCWPHDVDMNKVKMNKHFTLFMSTKRSVYFLLQISQ